MSWSGPASGPAQYQQPPYANPQSGYTQPQYPAQQYSQQSSYGPQYPAQTQYPQAGPTHHGPPENRPPKKKGNPVITRYPPPPGYRGPPPPYGSGQVNPAYHNQYQAPSQQGYQPGYPNQQTQGYTAPTAYPQTPGYAPTQVPPPQGYTAPQVPYQQPFNYQSSYQQPTVNYPQYPQQSYPPSQGYPQPPNLQTQTYPPQQGAYQGYVPPSGQTVDPNVQVYPQTNQGWQPPNGLPAYPQPYGPSAAVSQDPNATPVPSAVPLHADQTTPKRAQPGGAVVNGEPGNEEKAAPYLGWDDWDFDFEGPIWPRANDHIDPKFSLGVILWRPAKQVTRALPSTFAAAEEQALKPPPEKLGNGESVSMYFTLQNSHEAFLDIRQTDVWRKIKDDPIFVVFPDDKDMDLIPIEECIAQRDRPDVPVEVEVHDESDDDVEIITDVEMRDSNWNVMDNLEQALSSGRDDAKASSRDIQPIPIGSKGPSTSNQTQEDILAKLGVTGSPKPVFRDPGLSQLPPPEELLANSARPSPQHPEPSAERSKSYGGHPNNYHGLQQQRRYGSLSSTTRSGPPLPPAGKQQPARSEPWNTQASPNGYAAFDGGRESPVRSEASNVTAAGSDFETDIKPAPPNNAVEKPAGSAPRLEQSNSLFNRKRSYGETEQDDEKLRQQDDHTPRNKRRQAQVAAAYSRR
ncbi:hypothetical protein GQ43DRAFT_471516 [Delitschia confertaspora ATCC 74209]|uniref:Uncharacterized protein n=1 Tax=Delitschia confertaspora ATCC 74209 TaxID=1513339 RepID=A0A9P4MT62_9PLEO|nr:hypothetical protein GQ43DRAFT_471516 [Delitschia confertaspora ATCC 74209]